MRCNMGKYDTHINILELGNAVSICKKSQHSLIEHRNILVINNREEQIANRIL